MNIIYGKESFFLEFLVVGLKSSLRTFYGRHRYKIFVSQATTNMFQLPLSQIRSFPHSWLITEFVTIITRRVPLVEEELITNTGTNEFSPPVFSGVRVAQSLVFFVVFCRLFVLVSFFELPPLITHVVLQTFLNIMTSKFLAHDVNICHTTIYNMTSSLRNSSRS